MSKYQFIKYSDQMYDVWNSFIHSAKNSTFLFHRDYMDYHSERFKDYSIMVYEDDKLFAVLPANIVGDKLYSHQGLTYGGLVYSAKLKFRVVLDVFRQLLSYISKSGFTSIQLIMLPDFYSKSGNNEIDYLCYMSQAKLIKKQAFSVIDLRSNFTIEKNRLEGYKRGVKHGLEIKYDDTLEEFWREILVPNLKNKHQSKPVHTQKEIDLLRKNFPKNIIQVNVYKNKELVAGTTLFVTKNVVRTQYISANSTKNDLGSLDFLFCRLIKDFFKEKHYFDFGSSALGNLGQINKGLQYWKEGFGARTITQDVYEVNTDNYKLLTNILV